MGVWKTGDWCCSYSGGDWFILSLNYQHFSNNPIRVISYVNMLDLGIFFEGACWRFVSMTEELWVYVVVREGWVVSVSLTKFQTLRELTNCWLLEVDSKNSSCVLHKQTGHLFVLVIKPAPSEKKNALAPLFECIFCINDMVCHRSMLYLSKGYIRLSCQLFARLRSEVIRSMVWFSDLQSL